jgi:hypothetical protein
MHLPAHLLDELAVHEHAILHANDDAAGHDKQEGGHGHARLLIALEHELQAGEGQAQVQGW